MATPIPASYAALGFKDIAISHVPASSPTATKVVIVSFNRPTKLNALTGLMLTELEAAYKLFHQDERIRAIVLTGSGKAFCAGADLEVGFTGLLAAAENEESLRNFRDPGGPAALAIKNCDKPTIVAINGPAAGAGLTLTLPCAIRLAWSGAKVGIPFARRGIVFESCSAFYLPKLLGLAKATHIAMTGKTYPVTDPLVSGLFSQILDTPEETVKAAVALATDIAENTSLTSTKLMRDMLVYGLATPEETHLIESQALISMVGSKDNNEGVASFMEKRKPEYSGRVERERFSFWPWWGGKEEKIIRAKV